MAPCRAPRLATRAILLLLVAALFLPAFARAQGSLPAGLSKSKKLPLDITADQIDYLSKDSVYTAEGNVKITQKGRRLNANWVMLDVDSRIGVASGNVRLSDGKDVIASDFMEFNIDTLVGVIYRGRFDAKETGFKITGNEIRRLADKEYRLDEGTFTTCDCGPGNVPSWRIEGDRVDVTVDGYAKVRGTKFKIRDVPVAYIPYGIFPVKTTRQSGLLFPAIGNSSRNGFEFNLPYYWAISENTDATFYQDLLSKRGLKEGVEFRYIFQPETYGQANFWYLHDNDVNSSDPFGPDRWAVRWEALQQLPGGIRGRADVQNVSDNEYVIDFHDVGRDSSRYLESRGQIYKPWDAGIVALGAIHGDDLQSPDNLDRDKVVLNRYPYLNANLMDQKAFDSPLRFEWDSSFVNFHHAENPKDAYPSLSGGPGNGVFLDTGVDALFDPQEPGFVVNDPTLGDPHGDDDRRVVKGLQPYPINPPGDPDLTFVNPSATEGDGLFQEGEILANAGQRVDLYPRVSLPMHAGKYLNVRPELGFRETMWESSDFRDSTTHRDLVTGRLQLTSQIEKESGSPLARWESIRHVMKPEFDLITIQGSNDDPPGDNPQERAMNLARIDHPIFVPPGSTNESRLRYFAFDNVLQDQSDVIPDQTIVFYGVEHDFYAKDADESGTTRRLLRLRTGSAHDFQNSNTANWVGEATLDPTDNLSFYSDGTYNGGISRLDKFSIGGSVKDNRGDYLKLGYRLSKSFAPGFEDFVGNPDFNGFKSSFDEISEVNTNLRLRLLSNVDFLYRSNYSLNVKEVLNQAYSIIYRSKCDCWAANLSVIDNTRAGDTQVRFLVDLKGLGTIGNAGGSTGP